jgi:hypothetical protein
MAFIEQKAIERPDCQDLGVPIVEDDALCLGNFVLRKTFHSRARSSQPHDLRGIYLGWFFTLLPDTQGYLPLHQKVSLAMTPRPSQGSNQPCRWATMPHNGTHSLAPLPLFNVFPLAGNASNCFNTASAMSSPDIFITGSYEGWVEDREG